VIPLLVLDACASFYQWACFPMYGVAEVRHGDDLVFDRCHLGTLDFIEKFHCTRCEYGDGLMGYMAEILARGIGERSWPKRDIAMTRALRCANEPANARPWNRPTVAATAVTRVGRCVMAGTRTSAM
jgi:hypothetical protein